jgi:hypothetical protein
MRVAAIDVGTNSVHLLVADIDADGDVDLVIGEHRGSPNRVLAFENLDRGRSWRVHQLDSGPASEIDHHDGTQLVDLDGDGDLDIASIGWNNPKLWVYENRGGSSSAPAPPPTPTGELLLYDGTDLRFSETDRGFLPLIEPGDPLPLDNWLSPTDYYNGQLQIRYTILGPEDQAAGKLQTCIWTMNGAYGGRDYYPESCSSQVSHNGPGSSYNTALAPASWWKLDGQPLDFTKPERFLIRVVLRGTSGCNVTSYSVSNGCWDEWATYSAMTFRVTMVMVPKGASFSGWQNYP